MTMDPFYRGTVPLRGGQSAEITLTLPASYALQAAIIEHARTSLVIAEGAALAVCLGGVRPLKASWAMANRNPAVLGERAVDELVEAGWSVDRIGALGVLCLGAMSKSLESIREASEAVPFSAPTPESSTSSS